jgi:hypothetical protein
MTGNWTYSYDFSAGGDNATGSGSFTCVTSDKRGFLRQNPENPYRYAYDNGQTCYLNGFGICHGIHPWDPSRNMYGNDTVYDDKCWEFDGVERQWLRDHHVDSCRGVPILEQSPKCGCATHLEFFTAHSQAGFNAYRWSNGNCAYKLLSSVLNNTTGY